MMTKRFAEEKRVYHNKENFGHKITVTVRVENEKASDDVNMEEMQLIFRCAASGVGCVFNIENGGDVT